MNEQDQILNYLRINGPSLPAKIAKLLVTDILLASAHLSDLAVQGKVKVSHLKIGGSPLYHLPGQESQLYNFASGNLNPKDFNVLNILRGKGVLRETSLGLLEKVSLRSLKDFSIPLHVTVEGKKELFWKWHLLSAEQTNESIGKMFSPESIPIPLSPLVQLPIATESSSWSESKEVQSSIERELDSSKPRKVVRQKRADEFFPQVEESFKKLKISIEQKETIRKNTELDFILKVPSAVGIMTYFCKAKNKARCDEKDLSAAYMQALIKKLPLLLLYTGELTPKAQEMLESGVFENVMVRKI